MRDGWEAIRLGRIATQSRERVRLEMGRAYRTVGVLRDGQGLMDREPFVGGRTSYRELTPVRAGQMILRSITAWEAPVGVATEAHDGSHVSGVFPVFDLDHSRILPEYMALVCQHPPFWEEMRVRTTGTVLRRKTLNAPGLLSIPIDLPPLADQRRIVDLVGSAESLRFLCERVASVASQAYAAFLDAAAQTADRRLTVGDCVRVAKAGGTPSRAAPSHFGGGIPWLKSGEVDDYRISQTGETITEEGLRSSSAWLVPTGAVVVAMYGATAGAVGRTAIPLATNQAVLSLFSKPEVIEQGLMFHFLRWLGRDLKARAVGAAQPNLSKERVLEAAIPVPRLSSQQGLTMLLDDLLRVGDLYQALSSRTSRLRRALLSDLLSGDHEIPESYERFLNVVA